MAAQAFPLDPSTMALDPARGGGQQAPVGNQAEEQALAGQMIDPRQANQMEAIREIMAQMTPDEQKAFITKLATSQETQGGIGRDQQLQGGRMLSNAIRNQPQGRTTSGGLYTAANPLEHLANAGMGYLGNKRYNEGLDARKQAVTDQATKNELDLNSQLSMGDALRY